jgi:hypothetical protein
MASEALKEGVGSSAALGSDEIDQVFFQQRAIWRADALNTSKYKTLLLIWTSSYFPLSNNLQVWSN